MKKKYKLLVVTVTFKSIEDLPKFVESFNKYNDLGADARLIIVDNSPPEYRDIEIFVKSYADFDYVNCSENPGFGAANNVGFDLYDSEYVLFINNDVEFLEPVFQELISTHEKDAKLGCIGIKQEGGAPSYFLRQESSVMLSKKEIDLQVNYNPRYHFLSGAFLFFKSIVFRKIGKFDENIFMYFEEADVINRLNDRGYGSMYYPGLKFLHKVGNRKISNEVLSKKGSHSFCYYINKYQIKSKERILKNRTILRRKKQIYFLIKFNLSEVMKLNRIIQYEQRLFRKYFE